MQSRLLGSKGENGISKQRISLSRLNEVLKDMAIMMFYQFTANWEKKILVREVFSDIILMSGSPYATLMNPGVGELPQDYSEKYPVLPAHELAEELVKPKDELCGLFFCLSTTYKRAKIIETIEKDKLESFADWYISVEDYNIIDISSFQVNSNEIVQAIMTKYSDVLTFYKEPKAISKIRVYADLDNDQRHS
jgi:hypothetical protein